MSTRTPAGDKGTADRIEADDGGYWVRLVTKQAMLREGECMQNCLRGGAKQMLAGDEDTLSCALWSLRKRCGTSYALAEIGVFAAKTACQLGQLLGPHNHAPSPWAVRQVRHLRALFAAAGLDLWVEPSLALIGPDGMTHRPDKAPIDMRNAAEAERIENERQVEERRRQYRRDGYPSLRSRPADHIISEEVDTYPTPQLAPDWQTLLQEQASERARYERLGITPPRPVPTVAIGIDTQPAPAAETSPGSFARFVDFSMRYLGSCLGQSYEEFAGDWRATSERAELAHLVERIRARGLIISTPPMERSRAVHSLPALGLPYGTRPSGDRS